MAFEGLPPPTTTEPHIIVATFSAGSKEPVLKEVSVPVLKLPPVIEGLELRTSTDSNYQCRLVARTGTDTSVLVLTTNRTNSGVSVPVPL